MDREWLPVDRGMLSPMEIPMLTMRQFIERENVERFLKCLSTETDPAKRTILLKLLIEEKAPLSWFGPA